MYMFSSWGIEAKCLQGETILDTASKSARALEADYELYMRDAWSSKGMLQLIRSRKSKIGDAAVTAAVAAIDGELEPFSTRLCARKLK